jgi:PAS domain S-box-containing protein
MFVVMSARPKARSAPALVPKTTGAESEAKDHLLRRLELEQTIAAETIQRLEHDRQELDALRADFSKIYEQSPIGYMTLDKRGHIINVNTTALRLLGFERSRFQNVPLAFLVHKEDCKSLVDHLWRCEAEKTARVITELRLRNRLNDFVPIQLISVPMNERSKERQLYLTAMVDMTEHAQRAQALVETKDFAEAIVQTTRHPLVVLDPDLRIVSVNRAFTDFFERSTQDVSGQVLEVMFNLWWSGNELRVALERVLIKDEPLENYRLEAEPPNLGKRVLLVNARRLHQKEGLPHRLLVTLEDVTELEAARQQLRHTNQELERRVCARTEALRKSYEQMESFCYSIAHDLRAPLRSMTGFSQLLVDEFNGQISETGREYAGRIQQSAERMDQLIRDLLSYGRLNTAPLETSSVDLDKVFQEVLLHLDKDIREKRAKVRRNGKLPVVRGHHAVLQTVLANLISNALKFVAPRMRPCVEVSAETKRDWVRVWVADNGIGIAPENRQKIFGVFQRLHSMDEYPGTGIGLAIVAKGVERMGGRSGVASDLGKGSRFWFELPVLGREVKFQASKLQAPVKVQSPILKRARVGVEGDKGESQG